MTTTQNDHHFHKIRLKESASACPHNDSAFPVCWGPTCAETTFRHRKVRNICMLVHHRLHIGAMGGAFPISRALSALKRHSFERPYPRPRLLADTMAVIGTTRNLPRSTRNLP